MNNQTTKPKDTSVNYLKKILQTDKSGLIIAAIIMIVIFSILTNNNYFSKSNIINILISSSIVGLVTIGEGDLLIGAQVDLSPGSVSAFSGVLAALLLSIGVPTGLVLLIVVIAGICIGFLNSLLVNKLLLEPFIATLATMSIFRGLAHILCNGKAIFITNSAFLKLGVGRILGIPIPVIIFLTLFIIFGIILARTKFGRSIYMVGGNAVASRLAGINAPRVKMKLYMLTSALSALGGCILASRMNSGQPTASEGLEFDAVTAVVLGGIAMNGGIGTLSGALIGLFIMQGFNNGLLMLNVQSFWQIVARGLLLVVALSFDFIRNKNRK
ncbi:MAG: ABC transporter permease [Lachnospiraceae bacterium]